MVVMELTKCAIVHTLVIMMDRKNGATFIFCISDKLSIKTSLTWKCQEIVPDRRLMKLIGRDKDPIICGVVNLIFL